LRAGPWECGFNSWRRVIPTCWTAHSPRWARADAFIVLPSTMLYNERRRLVALAAQSRLPGMYQSRQFVELGGLIAYGASITDGYRRAAATYVDSILEGARPGELPVEQPTKFELLINLRTARALGLTIPPSLLQQADHVIE